MKKSFEPLHNAWEGVKSHKLRSSLTILGIVIGVASVIALMSIGRGAQASILSNIESLGSNLITISPGAVSEFGVRGASGSAASLTLEDAEAIADGVSYVDVVVPTSSSYMQLVAGDENLNAQVMGITPEYQQAYENLEISSGSFITESNYNSAAKVAVIGSNVAETLFGTTSPLGQQIRMGTNIVTVMGVLASEGSSMMGSNDDMIFIPLSTLQQTISSQRTSTGEHVVSSIIVAVSGQEHSEAVTEEITSLLRSRHRLTTVDEDDFSVQSMEELISTVSEMTGTLTVLLGAIAGISLLVGGIGVMNIMLVSVVERTREIGIRKALGAKERDIWGQILTESAFLSLSGGLIGVAAGLGASKIVSSSGLLGSMTTLVSPDIIILALSVSIGIGLLFGFLPARRAAALNPIEALRYE